MGLLLKDKVDLSVNRAASAPQRSRLPPSVPTGSGTARCDARWESPCQVARSTFSKPIYVTATWLRGSLPLLPHVTENADTVLWHLLDTDFQDCGGYRWEV